MFCRSVSGRGPSSRFYLSTFLSSISRNRVFLSSHPYGTTVSLAEPGPGDASCTTWTLFRYLPPSPLSDGSVIQQIRIQSKFSLSTSSGLWFSPVLQPLQAFQFSPVLQPLRIVLLSPALRLFRTFPSSPASRPFQTSRPSSAFLPPPIFRSSAAF